MNAILKNLFFITWNTKYIYTNLKQTQLFSETLMKFPGRISWHIPEVSIIKHWNLLETLLKPTFKNLKLSIQHNKKNAVRKESPCKKKCVKHHEDGRCIFRFKEKPKSNFPSFQKEPIEESCLISTVGSDDFCSNVFIPRNRNTFFLLNFIPE